MQWLPITNTTPTPNPGTGWKLSSPVPPSKCAVLDSHVLSLLPSHVLRLLAGLCRALRTKEVSPVVAWPAHNVSHSPLPVAAAVATVLAVALGFSAFALCLSFVMNAMNTRMRIATIINVSARMALALPSALKRILSGFRGLFAALRLRKQLYSSELIHLYDTYKHSVDDFVNMTRLCRVLQEQLRDRDARLQSSLNAIDTLTSDVDGVSAQNEYLREKLHFDKTRLREQLRGERAKHADILLSFQQDLEVLLKEIEKLEAEKCAAKARYEEHIKTLQDGNVRLREQIDALSHTPAPPLVQTAPMSACDHYSELASLTQRLAAADSALAAATHQNESLKEQLMEHESRASKYAQQHVTLVETLESFRRQLIDQQVEHTRQQDVLVQRMEIAKTDRSKMKAKLIHARADAATKSADLAHIQTALAEHERALSEQHASLAYDLRFVHAESHFERQMYKGALSRAQAESSALRQELAELFNRYRAQDERLERSEAGLKGAEREREEVMMRLRAALAEKVVADDVEDMLVKEVRRWSDEYETLEISFEVLESAYGFLAKETVRLEHALRDALEGRPVSPSLVPVEWDRESGFVGDEHECDDENEDPDEREEEDGKEYADADEHEEFESQPEEISIIHDAALVLASASLPLSASAPGLAPAYAHTPIKAKEPLPRRDAPVLSLARTPSSSTSSISTESSSSSTRSSSRAYHRPRRHSVNARAGSSASISSASSLFSFSERSWPATPGLTLDTTSMRSTPSSPVVATPPLHSPIYLPADMNPGREMDMEVGLCDSPTPFRGSGPADLEALFDAWSLDGDEDE